jgi:iron complex outermembrane recepter protein
MVINACHARNVRQMKREYSTPQRSGVAAAVAVALGQLASTAPVFAQTAGNVAAGNIELDEIIVSAQRRDQRITDVPYNITAVGSENLTASGVTSGNDLTKVVAGLGNFASGPADAFGENNFSLRGLRTSSAEPSSLPKLAVSSVSTYYGDTPVFFNVLLKDLERVEVLRGPQGTLYGSGAQAGAIRFIPKRPSFDGTSGEVNASTGITQEAGNPNYSADGVINLPLAENLALRVSAAYVRQAGFIDQVNLFQLDSNGVPVPSVAGDLTSGPVIAPIKKDTNSWDQWLVRSAGRYQPSDWLDLEVAYLHQETNSDDYQASNPAYQGGPRDISLGFFPNAPYQTRPGGKYVNTQPELQPVKAKTDLVTGTAAFDLGFAEFSSITSHYRTKTSSQSNGDTIYQNPTGFPFSAFYNFYPRFIATVPYSGKDTGFTEELRLVSQGDSAFSYVLGAYYQRQEKNATVSAVMPGVQAYTNAICAVVPNPLPYCFSAATPALPDLAFSAQQDSLNKEKAVFGELSYEITDSWQVTGGMRVFKSTQDFSNYQVYPFFGNIFGYWDGVAQPSSQGASQRGGSASASGTVFKVNTSYAIDPDNKVYFTYAEGFRRGGANPLSGTGATASLPEFFTWKPDFTTNYEIGIKGRTLGRRLTYALSLYHIDLKDFQFEGFTPNSYTAVFNGGKAKTEGLELEASFRATPKLTLSGSYTLTNTKVPEAVVIRDLGPRTLVDGTIDPGDIIVNGGASVAAGSKLPGISKHSANAAIDYEIPLAGDSGVILHTNASYRSKQNNGIAIASTNFTVLPSVFTADARITYDSGKGWSGSLFVTNLTNAFGSAGTQGVQTQSDIYPSRLVTTPRTFGLGLHYGF